MKCAFLDDFGCAKKVLGMRVHFGSWAGPCIGTYILNFPRFVDNCETRQNK